MSKKWDDFEPCAICGKRLISDHQYSSSETFEYQGVEVRVKAMMETVGSERICVKCATRALLDLARIEKDQLALTDELYQEFLEKEAEREQKEA